MGLLMYKFNGFTIKANNALNYGIIISEQLGHTYVGSEHLLLGLIREGTGVAASILSQKGITFEDANTAVIQSVGRGVLSVLSPSDFTSNCKNILEQCSVESRNMGLILAGTEHLLLAITTRPNSFACKYLASMGIDRPTIIRMIGEVIAAGDVGEEPRRRTLPPPPPPKPRPQNTRTATLDKFGRDLTEMAFSGRLDPVIGRDKEIERVIQILTRRTKNNPCLIGETGVGKTAIVEGLAQRISAGDIPISLQGKRIITVDLTSMVSGTKYRGDFEERIRTMIEEVITSGNIILFIDEIHTIMGVGAAEGAVDAANMMKPQLARGGFQVVGATTIDEYKKTIERDGALERRFQSVLVEEPSEKDTFAIICGIRDKYELHHQLTITDEAIHTAINLSQRYDSGRFLPDKAIDLIDEGAARLRLYANGKTKKELFLTGNDIAQIVSQTTGIDMSAITQEETKRYLSLDKTLQEQIVGQDNAIEKICKAVRRSRVGLKDPHRPIAGFLFAGPTGVGKTQLCRVLAESLFGNRDSIIKLDMSEYMEKHSISRLIGSPPGYIGFEEGGQLTDKIRRKPYSIVLFDEIEKAHPDIANVLLQILEDGEITDARGRKAVFKNAIVIMTTNVGASSITNQGSMGFCVNEEEAANKNTQRIMGHIKEVFRPELLNRLDDVIVFHSLSKTNLCTIAEMELERVKARLKHLHIEMEYHPSAIETIACAGYNQQYGARPLRRAVNTKVEDSLADKILVGELKNGDHIICSFSDDKLQVEKTKEVILNL